MLVHYDVNKPGTSARGVGACLMHVINGEEKPVAYASWTLSLVEVNYVHIEHQVLVIIFGVITNHFIHFFDACATLIVQLWRYIRVAIYTI